MAGEGNGKRSVSIPVATLVSLIGVVVGGGAGGIVAPARLDARMAEMDKRANEQEVKFERILTQQEYILSAQTDLKATLTKLDEKLEQHLMRHNGQ